MEWSREFELDENGDVITKPVTGWKLATIAESAVLLAIQYRDSPAEPESADKSLQLALTPAQCLELAEALAGRTGRILAQPPFGKPN